MRRLWRQIAAASLVASLGLVNCATQIGYLSSAARKDWTGMMSRLRGLATLTPGVPVLIGLQDYPQSNLVALYARGHPAWNLSGTETTPVVDRGVGAEPPQYHALITGQLGAYHRLDFDLEAEGMSDHFARFETPGGISVKDGYAVLPARDGSVVNGSQERPNAGAFYPAALSAQRDTLVQVDSSLGRIIVPGLLENIGLWQLEGDYAGAPGGIQGLGRHVLFEVLNPVPGSRLLLDYTTMGLSGQGFSLPATAAVIGAERMPLEFEGQGAGRVLSDAITPREIDGHFYIAIDMGADAVRFPSERHGLAALFNNELHTDPRHLVGFTRNISLLTPEQVAALTPPPAIASFPAGLFDPGLLYSGVSEDGWLADKAWFELALPGPSNFVHVTGEIPGFSAKILGGTVKLLADGVTVAEGKLIGGAFDLIVPIPEVSGPREIGFAISGVDRLPAPDGRLVSLHLTSLSLGRRDAAPKPGSPQ